jgi:lysophospholipase L1-like esterase
MTYSRNVTRNKLLCVSPDGLRRARRALDDAQFSPMSVMCIGDSISDGWGSDNPSVNYPSTTSASAPSAVNAELYSYPSQLRNLFASRFVGRGVNPAGFLHAKHNLATLSGGGSPGEQQGLHGNKAIYLNGGGSSLTFALPACTAVDVLYWEASSSQDLVITIDGGTPTTITHLSGTGVNTGTGTYKWASVTGLSNATHSVVLTSGLIVICGIRYHSGYGVAVGRMAVAGRSASDSIGVGDFNVESVATSRANALIAYQATPNALNIVAFSNNDYSRQASYGNSLTEYEATLRAIVAQGAAAGGCTLLLGLTMRDLAHPTAATGPIQQVAYWDVMRKIAVDTDHVAHVRLIDMMGSYVTASAAGQMTDGEHPKRVGHGLIANSVFQLLTNTNGESGA